MDQGQRFLGPIQHCTGVRQAANPDHPVTLLCWGIALRMPKPMALTHHGILGSPSTAPREDTRKALWGLDPRDSKARQDREPQRRKAPKRPKTRRWPRILELTKHSKPRRAKWRMARVTQPDPPPSPSPREPNPSKTGTQKPGDVPKACVACHEVPWRPHASLGRRP